MYVYLLVYRQLYLQIFGQSALFNKNLQMELSHVALLSVILIITGKLSLQNVSTKMFHVFMLSKENEQMDTSMR